MAAVPNYAERRAFGRRAANLTGYVYLPGKAGITCVIKDVSEGGALLEFAERVTLPSRLRLMREGSDIIADCNVRHTRGQQAGVQFLTEAGRQLARDVFKLNAAETAPPLAPMLRRDTEVTPSRGSELVQRLRVQRQKPIVVGPSIQPFDGVAATMDTAVPRDIFAAFESALHLPTLAAVPLPLPAHRYKLAWVPLPLAAGAYAHVVLPSSARSRPMPADLFA